MECTSKEWVDIMWQIIWGLVVLSVAYSIFIKKD